MAQRRKLVVDNYDENQNYQSRNTYVEIDKAKVPFKYWLITNLMNTSFMFENDNLSKTAHRILWYCIEVIEFDNIIVLNKSECAKRLKVSQKSIIQGVKELIEADVLIETNNKIGNVNVYSLNPYIFWRGEGKSWYENAMPILQNIDNPERFRNGLRVIR